MARFAAVTPAGPAYGSPVCSVGPQYSHEMPVGNKEHLDRFGIVSNTGREVEGRLPWDQGQWAERATPGGASYRLMESRQVRTEDARQQCLLLLSGFAWHLFSPVQAIVTKLVIDKRPSREITPAVSAGNPACT
jgi:hypothetical protein